MRATGRKSSINDVSNCFLSNADAEKKIKNKHRHNKTNKNQKVTASPVA